MLSKRYDLVHSHLLEASLIGIISAKMSGIKKRIHTRHHSDFHHTYFPHAVKYDKLVNRYSTHIIAVSKGVEEILIKEGVEENKITIIPHGIPKNVIQKIIPAGAVKLMKEKYELNGSDLIIGVVSRFTIWKGVQYIIPAFKELLKEFPKAKLVLANAKGEYETEIKKLLHELPETSYKLITFENDMPSLFSTFDVFVHAPINTYCEAFGQVYLETMCYGIPMVCTLSGVANELVVNEKNALVVEYKNSEGILKSVIKIKNDPHLKDQLIAQAKVDVMEYTFEKKMDKLLNLYRS